MNVSSSGLDANRKRDIARRLYQALAAKYADAVITLCDSRGRVLARNDLRPEEHVAQNTSWRRAARAIGRGKPRI